MRKRKKRHSTLLLTVLAILVIALSALVLVRLDAEQGVGMESPAPLPEATESMDVPQESTEQMAGKLETAGTPTSEPTIPIEEPEVEQVTTPPVVERYAAVAMTEDELRDVAAIIFLEAGNQSAEGQQAVVEVIFNRCIADNFPDTVAEVLYQGAGTKCPQFSTIGLIDTVEPLQDQYDAINAALYGPSILPTDVVFFSRGGENDRVWGRIEDHVFCYQYIWE